MLQKIKKIKSQLPYLCKTNCSYHRLNFRGASFREAEITPVQPAQDNTCEGRNAHSPNSFWMDPGTIALISGFQSKRLLK